ncbi:MarR family winged helix-turn-helix transcriptional regulator [Cognatishimia sp. F0-27]|uniref:MarR family winged helix-turn-helix transcriptional regulator n=1 Tax=Cognatishimia sp. F0-27 TaxID=2816855 RepID=UPI001D0C4DDA|nr:MarR family transcriptional regulator [Cognatishimia sp. F0-27]MCC1493789.1 MarR family transcriptional regulator [Cognatishimia sp. F0-27]
MIEDGLSKDRLRLWLKLLKTQSAIEAALRRKLRDEFATTLPRFDVMSALARHRDGLKMSEISAALKVSNGNITGILDRLTAEGLAERVAVPNDRRAALARLTPKGHARFAELARAHESWLNETLGGLDKSEIDMFAALLQSITHPMRGASTDREYQAQTQKEETAHAQ